MFTTRRSVAVCVLAFAVACLVSVSAAWAIDASGAVTGVVRDPSGAVVVGADVALLTAQQTNVRSTRTGADGRFSFDTVSPGRYVLLVSYAGFADRRTAVHVSPAAPVSVDVTLDPTPVEAEVTVTATPGLVQDIQAVSQPVNVIESGAIFERVKTVVAQAVLEEPGVNLLRTSSTMAGIYIRGLTGNKVNVFVDGVRYSNSAQRGGVNTFLDLIEPTSLQAIEVLRGPNSAQYGSDAMAAASSSSRRRRRWPLRALRGARQRRRPCDVGGPERGDEPRRGVLGRTVRHNRQRGRAERREDPPGPGDRFSRRGDAVSRPAVRYADGRPAAGHRVRPVRRGDEGELDADGNLIADLRDVMLDFFYAKYNRADVGPFDQVTAIYSFNTQREERVNQGGNGNPTASITHEYERMYSHGFQIKAVSRIGDRQELLLGAETYPEHIKAPSYAYNPVTGATTVRRGRVPDQARYWSAGIYAQDAFELVPGKLRLIGDLRYSGAQYRSDSADAPVVNGKPLWPDDAVDASSVTFRAGVVASPWTGWSLTGNVSRGFRAPHITDLGTLGLTGSGYTVSADEVAGRDATVGTAAGATAVSTGLPVEQAGPETSMNYEAGVSYRSGRISTSASVFANTVYDNIVYQALILPQGAVGTTLGDQVISTQLPNGVVYVPASSSPVLVRVNYGDARIKGVEHQFDWRIAPRWSVGTVLTILHAADLATGLAPNIEGGTPGPDFWLRLRYGSPRGRYWLELMLHVVGEQARLSSLDLEDRRTGATRTRTNIRNFFYNGATVRGWVAPGPDLVAGTADDVLTATGETLAQVQNRVLGTATSAPLFTSVHGYTTVGVRGGFRIGKRHEFILEFENLTDANYRGIAWGLDAPGRGFSVGYAAKF